MEKSLDESLVIITTGAYDETAISYEQDTFALIPALEIEKFVERIPKGGRVLDAGCGYGREVREFWERGLKPMGIDRSEGMIRLAQKRNPDLEFQQMDVRRLGFTDESFDGVFCRAVLNHLTATMVQEALLEFYRVLKTDGVCLVVVKEGEGEKIENGKFNRCCTAGEIRVMLEQAGFTIRDEDLYIFNERDRFGEEQRDLNWVVAIAKK